MKRLWRVFPLVVILLFLAAPASAQTGVSDERYARMARGINLPFWFWYAPPTPEEVEARFSDADFQLIRDLGFTFVRLPIDLNVIMDTSSPDLLNADNLAAIDRGLDRLLANGLAVMVDLHSTAQGEENAGIYSYRLESEPDFVDTYARFWRSLAAHLSSRDPEWLFLEPMNEPVFEDNPKAWIPIQNQLLAAVREGAPDHTVILSGAQWSDIDALVGMQPVDDPNVIYNFHYYEPFVFTHQGAEWSWDVVRNLRGVPYPSSPAAVEPVAVQQVDPNIQNHLRWYGQNRWDVTKIEQHIRVAVAWAEWHEVRLLCNEFGVYGVYAPSTDRARWIEDVRTTLEKYGIGWAMWEFDREFGLGTRENGQLVINPAIAQALGLRL
jgi:hypothetical protein